MTAVTFGGLVFDDEAPSGFAIAKLVGWYDAAPTRYNAEERPQGHGTFKPGKIYRGARVVSMQGSWSGDSLEDAYAAREALAGLQADGETSPFVVTDILGRRYITAGVVSAPTADDGLYQPYFKWSFDVVADDPLKYELTTPLSTGLATAAGGIRLPLRFPVNFGSPAVTGRIRTENRGTAETFSRFTVRGGTMTGGFTLVDVPTGRLVVVSRNVVPSDVVGVDMRTGALTVNGFPTPGFLDRADWWSVPRRGSTDVQFLANGPTTGSPTLTALTEPAYL
jgi:hypothetical protein